MNDLDLVLPSIYDVLYTRWSLKAEDAGLTAADIFDGPAAKYAGTEGVAVGATADETRATIQFPAADLSGGQAEKDTAPCLIWSGSGGPLFKPLRDRVRAIFVVLAAEIARDRTLDGLVTSSWITGGELDQVQTFAPDGRATGPLVTCEFRIDFDRF